MDMSTIFNVAAWAAAGIGVLSFIGSGLYTVAQEHQALVTRFGRHVRTNETPGLKFKIPFIEQKKEISMQEYQVDESLTTKTTDDLFVDLPIAIHFQISDPATYWFKKGDAQQLMKKVVAAAVREYTSKKSFQELYDERQEIRHGVLEKVEQQVSGFGLQINDIVMPKPNTSSKSNLPKPTKCATSCAVKALPATVRRSSSNIRSRSTSWSKEARPARKPSTS